MRSHSIKLTDDELRMVIVGLDIYADKWQGYSNRRRRDFEAMRGVRVNSSDEKRLQELMKTDVLAANSIVNQVHKLRDHLALILGVHGAE